MEVVITDDKRRPVPVKVKDTGVGTYHAEYTAEKPGMHFIRSALKGPSFITERENNFLEFTYLIFCYADQLT